MTSTDSVALNATSLYGEFDEISDLINTPVQRDASLHNESLYHVPLVRHFLDDPSVGILKRGLDQRWAYQGTYGNGRLTFEVLPGFHPAKSSVFVAENSLIARWLKNPAVSARSLNYRDYLCKEVLRAVHDYLHCWAYLVINDIAPHLEFGTRPVDRDNFEDFAFCHLLTEAVATVGLDYWFLSTVDLNDFCPIGTDVSWSTIAYREQYLPEYRRFHPTLTVQHPDFFSVIAEFFCSGHMPGFDQKALSSPRVSAWLTRELHLGLTQRQYTREWLGHLAGAPHLAGDLRRPVACSKPWQRALTRQLGERLWAKVKQDDTAIPTFVFDQDRVWRAPAHARTDFRFMNVSSMSNDECLRRLEETENPDDLGRWLRQLITRCEFEHFDVELLEQLSTLGDQYDLARCQEDLSAQQLVESSAPEPADIFMQT